MYTERTLYCHIRNRFMLTNLACLISTLRGEWDYTTDRLGVMAQKAEKMINE